MYVERHSCTGYILYTCIRVYGDHVTVIWHVREEMGYRNEFQTENYGPLTNQSLFLNGVCSFSQLGHMIIEKFAYILK
jgi:hypothetical protein